MGDVIVRQSLERIDRGDNGRMKPEEECRKWRLRVKVSDGDRTEVYSSTEKGVGFLDAAERLEYFARKCRKEFAVPKFYEYIEPFLAEQSFLGKSDETIAGIRGSLNAVFEYIPDKKLNEVDRWDVTSAFIRACREREWSRSSLIKHKNNVSNFFESAIDDGFIDKSPVHSSDILNIESFDKTREIPNVSLVDVERMLLDMDLGNDFELAVAIVATCGLSSDEVVALKWGAIEWCPLVIHVVDKMNGKGVVEEIPSQSNKKRSVPIMHFRLAEEFRKRQHSAKCDDFVVEGISNPDQMNRWWMKNAERFGMGGIRLSDLKKCFVWVLSVFGYSFDTQMKLGGIKGYALSSAHNLWQQGDVMGAGFPMFHYLEDSDARERWRRRLHPQQSDESILEAQQNQS